MLGEACDYPDGTDVTSTVGSSLGDGDGDRLARGRLVRAGVPGPDRQLCHPTLSFALYVDVNGDGTCQLATDDVFARSANQVDGG